MILLLIFCVKKLYLVWHLFRRTFSPFPSVGVVDGFAVCLENRDLNKLQNKR